MRLTRMQIIGATVIAAGLVGGTLFLLNRDLPYDRSFDARVAEPAYGAGGPIVLYDESHRNTHTTTGGYKPLADLLRSDGYRLQVSSQPITARMLEGVSILVLALAQGANDTNDDPAYSEAEIGVIDAWVRNGGSLLLISDHWPYGSAVATLARRFDVVMGGGLVQDETHCDHDRGDSHLVFSAENGLLRDHPIVRGRSPVERVQRVLTFTGQSLQGPDSAVAFLRLSEEATERPPGPARAERNGGDLIVRMDYTDPVAVPGRAQGLALEAQKGRVVMLGEAGMLRAQRERNGNRVGMNVPGYDNRQLALNILHWLSRIL